MLIELFATLGVWIDLPLGILFCLPGVLLAITLHEYTKARCSTAFGDPRPRNDGRLTLNPFKHIEPIGFICTCLWGMGWGKPSIVTLNYFEPKNRRRNALIVYITPVVVNLFAGLALGVCAMSLRHVLGQGAPIYVGIATLFTQFGALEPLSYVYLVLLGAAAMNICFALVQCIPIYPMAGERVLAQFLKPEAIVKMVQYQAIWQILLIMGMAGGWIGKVVYPICRALLWL